MNMSSTDCHLQRQRDAYIEVFNAKEIRLQDYADHVRIEAYKDRPSFTDELDSATQDIQKNQ